MIIVTGAAGFIGFHAARALLQSGHDVFGVDSLNDYYDPALKHARLAELSHWPRFRFATCDIADHLALRAILPLQEAEAIVHLAAQAGVRHSLNEPFAYQHANVQGHLSVLECARFAPRLRHLVYASSSSVYGDRRDGACAETDRCDEPASLYAATKRACELMSHSYARLYGIPQTGLRFFTVYGPWGRPDMAYWLFADAILRDQPISLYHGGAPARDFTYVDDVAPVFPRLIDKKPSGDVPHEIYNLGNAHPRSVADLLAMIEIATHKTAHRVCAELPNGDVVQTFANCDKAARDFAYRPQTDLGEGVGEFVRWFRSYHKV